jgi:PHP family Zn ribbon phosphoesterase
MVISDLYIERISFLPDETYPPLVVDSNTVLTYPLFLKGFEMVTTIDCQHPEFSRGIQHQKLAARRLLDRLKSDYGVIVEDGFGIRILERAYSHYAHDMT